MTTYVTSGVTSTGLTVGSAGQVQVLSGGTAIDTVVNSSGTQVVWSGGTVSGTILSGGTELDNGVASFTTVSNGGSEVVSSGGTAVGTIVNRGGAEDVYGTTSGTTLSSGGQAYVYLGGGTSGTTVDRKAIEWVSSGGTATGTIVSAGGREYVYSGGSVGGTVVGNGGQDNVYFSGTASGTIVGSGGEEIVQSGGMAISATVSGGGYEYVSAGTASGTTVSSGGGDYVFSGGTASGTTVLGDGDEYVSSGGTASGTIVSSDGTQYVYDGKTIGTILSGTEFVFSGGAASGTVVGDGGYEYVYLNGTASGTIVRGGGDAVVSGTASGTIVSSGGYEYVSGRAIGTVVTGGKEYVRSGGMASGTVVNSGYEYVCSVGTASGTVVSGGEEQVSGTAIDTTVSSGGIEYVYSGGTASATTVSSGGTEYVSSGGTAVGIMLSAGGTAVLRSGAVTSGGITLAGSGARLEIDGTAMPSAPISGFLAAATIDLADEAYTSGGQATLGAGNVLQITGLGAPTLDLQLDQGLNYNDTSFLLASDGSGGTDIMSDTTYTWIGGSSDNDASVAANWSPASGPPQPGDTIVVPGGKTLNANGGTLSDSTLGVSGPSTTINFTEVTDNNNTVTVGSGVVWNIAGTPATTDGTITTGSTITGDIDTFGTSDTLNLTDTSVNDASFAFASGDTLDLTGSTAGSMVIDPNGGGGNQTKFYETGSDASLLINAYGTVTNNGMIWFDSTGGSATLDIQPDGSNPGTYDNESGFIVAGGTLLVESSGTADVFANDAFNLDYGGTAASLIKITAPVATSSGEFAVIGGADGATLELDTKIGGGQSVVFGDGDGTLRIDATGTLSYSSNTTVLANTKAHIDGFRLGDTIDLVGLSSTNLIYSYTTGTLTYGDGVMELFNSGTLIGLLRIAGGVYADGTGDVATDSFTSNFVLAPDGSGGTKITMQSATLAGGGTVDGVVATWNAGTIGGTEDWSDPSMWTGGEGSGGVPGQYQAAQISFTDAQLNALNPGDIGTEEGAQQFLVTVSTAETAGSVVFDNPFGTLEIGAALTLAAPAGANGGVFDETNGTVDIIAHGTLTADRFSQVSGDFTLGAGGSIYLSGLPPFAASIGNQGLEIESQGTISGGTLTALGATQIGEQDPAGLQVYSGSTITDTYTQIGGETFAATLEGESSLSISGPDTQWTDAGGDASTPYSGAMLVGGGYPGVNGSFVTSISSGGDGQLSVDQGATLTDASYAILGVTQTSMGQATVSNGAVWNIDPTGAARPDGILVGTSTIYTTHSVSIPALMVGLNGSGQLDIQSGGTVQLGPVTTPNNNFVMVIGEGGSSNQSASGQVNVDGVGSLLNTGGGPLVIGLYGSGQVNVSNGGTVVVANSGTGSANSGAILGWDNAGTVDSHGTLQVSGNGTAESLFSVQAGNLVIGDNGYGIAEINSGGSLSVAAGDILLGGSGVGNNAGTSGASGTLDVFGGQVAASGLWVVSNPTLTQASSIDISNSGTVSLARSGGPAFDLASGNAQISYGGLLSFDNTGTAEIGNAALNIDNNGTMAFAGYTGTSYQLIVGDGTPSGSASTVTVAGGGASLIVPGPISIGQTNSGTLTVGSNASVIDDMAGSGVPWSAVVGNAWAGTLAVGGSGDVDAQFSATALAVGLNSFGLLRVGQGGTVSVSRELDVGGSPLAGALAANGTGQVTIDGGGVVGDALVSVTGSIVVGNTTTLTGNSSIIVANGGSLHATGTLYLGDTLQGGALAGSNESGALSLTNDSQAQLGGLALWTGSSVSMDSSSELVLGSVGIPTGAPGDILLGSDGVLSGGGTIGTIGSIIDNGLIEATVPGSANLLKVMGGISGSGTLAIAAGATLEIGPVASTDTIVFSAGTLDTLVMTTTGSLPFPMQASIEHFYAGNTIDLTGQNQAGVTLTWDQESSNSGVLSVTNGATLIAGLNFVGAYAQGSFSTQIDGFGGTDIVNDTAPCFAAGTRVATTRGEVAVEQLRVGDQVRLARGGTAPVLWLGHRTVDCARHPHPRDVMPVRVAAHAFGSGQPSGDLLLSPDHAVFVDGVLIPVRYLLNGATVVQEAASRVTYWHVELDHHDVLLAEGLACESYLDTGNRGAFANGGGATMMHADFALKVWERESCARLVVAGAELEAARSYLLDRARGLGFAITGEPDLHLVVGGESLWPTAVADGVYRFTLPADAAAIVIASRSAIPGEMADVYEDGRRLGVMLARITFRQHGEPHEVALDGLPDNAGFHALEQDGRWCWRWTDGHARLEVPAGLAPDAPVELDLHVVASRPTWIVTADDDRGRAVSAAA